jgi:dGTPase
MTSTPSPPISLKAALTIDDRVAREAVARHPRAAVAAGAGDRRDPEAPDPFRTCFERDRDRILHSAAFRRLAGKTQVFIFPQDQLRTRLTHALEVAQVAHSIARACRLDVALTEAIALGHDCGHGPGGHASEEALSPYVPGGFDHAVWGADHTVAGLNLCAETLDGIRNHSWRRPLAATLEGQVVSWSDRIAYVCHDFEDAVLAGVVSPRDLPAEVHEECGSDRAHQLDTFVRGAIGWFATTGTVGLPPALAHALDTFRAFNFERIYLRPASSAQAAAVVRVLRALVEHLATVAEHGDGTDEPVLAAVTSVAGMTDRFACDLAVRMLDYPTHDLPRGIDLAGG